MLLIVAACGWGADEGATGAGQDQPVTTQAAPEDGASDAPKAEGTAPESPGGTSLEFDLSGTEILLGATAVVTGMGGAVYTYDGTGLVLTGGIPYSFDVCNRLNKKMDADLDVDVDVDDGPYQVDCLDTTELTSPMTQAQCLTLRANIIVAGASGQTFALPLQGGTFTAYFGPSFEESIGIGAASDSGEVIVTGGRTIGGQQWGFGGRDESFSLDVEVFGPTVMVYASWQGVAVETFSGDESGASVDIACEFAFPSGTIEVPVPTTSAP